MDETKCKALKAELAAQSEPQIVSIERFFDGNDDLGSIGCNLMEHPGVDTFREFAVVVRAPEVFEVGGGECGMHEFHMLERLLHVGEMAHSFAANSSAIAQPRRRPVSM